MTIIGFTQCVCDWTAQDCEKQIQLPTPFPDTTESTINNYTSTSNCTGGIHLGNFMYIHVCWYGGEILIDIRHFSQWDGKPTIKGVGLKNSQWFRLTQDVGTINKLIKDHQYANRIFKYNDWHL